jgi:hypothetical protein
VLRHAIAVPEEEPSAPPGNPLLLTLGALSWLVGRGLIPAPSPPDAGCFTRAVDAAREDAGLPALSVNRDLAAVAGTHAGAMKAAGRIFHNPSLPGQAPEGWRTVGENVGMGPSCAAVARALMRSPEHRANILDPTYTQVGVGVGGARDGTVYVTEDFLGTATPASP